MRKSLSCLSRPVSTASRLISPVCHPRSTFKRLVRGQCNRPRLEVDAQEPELGASTEKARLRTFGTLGLAVTVLVPSVRASRRLGLAVTVLVPSVRASRRLGLAVAVLVPSVRASRRLGLAVAVLVPSVRASRRLGLATSVVVRFHPILADTRLHILREDHRFVALRGSEAVSMLVGLHVLGANTFIVFRNLGVRAGRRRLGLALSVLDSVVAFDTDVLVLVEDLFVSALRSADVLVVWLEVLVVAHTMTFVVPRLILGALHDAHVLVVFVVFLALTLVGPLVKLLVLLLAFGLLGRLRLGNVAFPVLVDTVLRTADITGVERSVRAAFSVALALVRRTLDRFVTASLSVGPVRAFVDLVIASGPTTRRVLLRPQKQVEDREPPKVDIEIDAQSGDIAHTPEVDPVLLRPPALERGGPPSELVRLGLDGRGVCRSEAGEGETESQEFGESSHC